MTARISVGVPVYNGENYLSGALQALVDQDVDGLETRQRSQPHAPLPDDEIRALGEVEPQPSGEVRLLDVRRMIDAAGQHHDPWVARGRHVGERHIHKTTEDEVLGLIVAGDAGLDEPA